MVFVLSHCRGHHQQTSQEKRVSYMSSLKMSLKRKKITVVCYLRERERERARLYESLSCSVFVDYLRNLLKHVSVVLLLKVVYLVLWLSFRKIINLRFQDCHVGVNDYIVLFIFCMAKGAETGVVIY